MCFLFNSQGGTGGPDPPEKKRKIGFLSNTGPDSLENHKASKSTFNDGGPLKVVFGSSITLKKKKKKKRNRFWTPSDKSFWIHA